MDFKLPEIEIESYTLYGENCLRFKFTGKFTEEACLKACAAWKNACENKGGLLNCILIWDCLEMNGFELGAKNEWVKTLNLFEKNIAHVAVVSDNLVYRGASHLMLGLFSFTNQVAKSYDQLNLDKLKTKIAA